MILSNYVCKHADKHKYVPDDFFALSFALDYSDGLQIDLCRRMFKDGDDSFAKKKRLFITADDLKNILSAIKEIDEERKSDYLSRILDDVLE